MTTEIKICECGHNKGKKGYGSVCWCSRFKKVNVKEKTNAKDARIP